MTTKRYSYTPAISSSAEDKIDAGLRRVHQDFGDDLDSFFATVIAQLVQRQENCNEHQDTRFIKAREPRQ